MVWHWSVYLSLVSLVHCFPSESFANLSFATLLFPHFYWDWLLPTPISCFLWYWLWDYPIFGTGKQVFDRDLLSNFYRAFRSEKHFQSCSSAYRYKVEISVYIVPIAFGLMGIARTSSVYLTMAVTLERYYAIVKPFASKEWLSSRKPVFACFLFGTIYNIPKWVVKLHFFGVVRMKENSIWKIPSCHHCVKVQLWLASFRHLFFVVGLRFIGFFSFFDRE